MSADLFIVVNGGANLEQLLLFTINDINDVSNAYRATTLLPRVPDDNTTYVRGIRLLASLQDRDATELAFGTEDESDDALLNSSGQELRQGASRFCSGPHATGYVSKMPSLKEEVKLLKQEKGLYAAKSGSSYIELHPR